MIALEPHAEGSILPVRAHAGARRSAIRGEHAGALRVAVTQAPEKGKANKAILELLAEALALGKSQLELVSGESSAVKRFLVRGLFPEELSGRLACVGRAHAKAQRREGREQEETEVTEEGS